MEKFESQFMTTEFAFYPEQMILSVVNPDLKPALPMTGGEA